MNVRVELELDSIPTESNLEDASSSARYLTNDAMSVAVYVLKDKPNTIVAEFTINKARQGDVVDRIARQFRFYCMYNFESTISFPHTPSRMVQKPRPGYTRKQGQYLAFIHYYTKLNGRPPAEADMQRFFGTTPPTVHNMVLQLEKRGFIERRPNQPRSIKLLLSREDLPDLD